MTQEEYKSIDWNRGNVVRLSNGKEYSVRGKNNKYIILYSEEYQKHFVADYRIIDCRVSDNIEPFVERLHPTEKQLRKEAAQEAESAKKEKAASAPKPDAAPVAKAEPAPKAKPEPMPEAAAKADAPTPVPEAAEQPAPAPEKKTRKRITVSRSEKVQY